jgi:ectoine utilization protein EutD
MAAFERAEYVARIAKTKARMEAAGIEVLLAADPANMNYLTGYDGWSFYVHQLVVLALDADEPVWIGRLQDANGARVTTYLQPEHIIGYPDRYVQSTERHPMDFVADHLRAQGWERAAIGVEMDAYYFTAAAHAALVRNLPDAGFKDATALVNWVRAVKSPAELAYIREAARIIEKQVAVDAVAPGVRQCDAAAAIHQAAIEGTPEFGGDYTAIVPLLPTGLGTSTPHLTWSDDRFKEGEATILELAGCRLRYHCPMARTVQLGVPPAKLADTAEIVVEGLEAALAAAKPGATAEQVEAAWRRVIARHGIEKESRIGYSAGLNYPPDWGEHTISLRPGDKTVLEPNMTLHLIPGIWMDDWGIEISEFFQVTESGAETFADFPRKLFVKE